MKGSFLNVLNNENGRIIQEEKSSFARLSNVDKCQFWYKLRTSVI